MRERKEAEDQLMVRRSKPLDQKQGGGGHCKGAGAIAAYDFSLQPGCLLFQLCWPNGRTVHTPLLTSLCGKGMTDVLRPHPTAALSTYSLFVKTLSSTATGYVHVSQSLRSLMFSKRLQRTFQLIKAFKGLIFFFSQKLIKR